MSSPALAQLLGKEQTKISVVGDRQLGPLLAVYKPFCMIVLARAYCSTFGLPQIPTWLGTFLVPSPSLPGHWCQLTPQPCPL